MEKTCQFCDKKFSLITNKKFCDSICRNDSKNLKRKKEEINFNCLICETSFIQKRKDNKTCSNACTQKLWIKNNPDKNYERYNSEEAKKSKKRWLSNNKEKIRIIKQRYKKKRRNSDIKFKLNELMGNAIRQSIKDKSFIKWGKIVGYDIETLIQHLEKKFEDNMTWEKYFKGGYHIDHIIPISLYNFKRKENSEFKKCWNYRNLRIIKGKKNLEKLNKIDLSLIEKFNIKDLLPKNFKYGL